MKLLVIIFGLILASQGYENTTKVVDFKPSVLKDLKCVDRNLQRTLTWKSENVSDNLQLVEYRVKYCISLYCNNKHKTAECYTNKTRTEKIRQLTTNVCIIVEPEFWSTKFYRVRGIYRNTSTNTIVKSHYVKKFCQPVDEDTILTAPSTNVTADKSSITIIMTLDPHLEKILKADLVAKYSFCVYKSGEHCSTHHLNHKISDNPSQNYIGLDSDTEYEIQAWYNVTGDNKPVKSQINTSSILTLPDLFPTWAQITLVLSLSGFVIVTILIGISIKMTIWKKCIEISKLTKQKFPEFYEETKIELKLLDEPNEDALINNWMSLQRTAYEDVIGQFNNWKMPSSETNKRQVWAPDGGGLRHSEIAAAGEESQKLLTEDIESTNIIRKTLQKNATVFCRDKPSSSNHLQINDNIELIYIREQNSEHPNLSCDAGYYSRRKKDTIK